MFLLHDLRFVLCSRDLDVQRAQRIIGFFSLITHKSKRSEKWSDHMKVSHTVYRSSWRVAGFRIKKAPLEKKNGSIAFPLTKNWTKLQVWKLDFATFFYNISQISPCYGEVLFFSAQHWLTNTHFNSLGNKTFFLNMRFISLVDKIKFMWIISSRHLYISSVMTPCHPLPVQFLPASCLSTHLSIF